MKKLFFIAILATTGLILPSFTMNDQSQTVADTQYCYLMEEKENSPGTYICVGVSEGLDWVECCGGIPLTTEPFNIFTYDLYHKVGINGEWVHN